jgi:predicted transcriptional regulator
MHKDNFFYKLAKQKKFQHLAQEEGAIIDIVIAIAEARKKKRLTQAQLAKKVGMPQSQLARIESGNHNVTLKNLARVAGALDLRVRVTV